MERDYKVSVAMAAYNGEKYIKEQIETILINLQPGDELIISDDCSKDDTREIVASFNDERIKLIDGPCKGVKPNFQNAISACTGKYIFLCDQDDIWAEGKVDKVLEAFEKTKALVVVHDCTLIDEAGTVTMPSFFEYKGSGRGFIKNFMRNTFMGCCMAFDARMVSLIIPVPSDIEMHDQWIGLLAEMCGSRTCFILDSLIKYRRHGSNESDCFHHYGFKKMLTNRIHLAWQLWRRTRIGDFGKI